MKFRIFIILLLCLLLFACTEKKQNPTLDVKQISLFKVPELYKSPVVCAANNKIVFTDAEDGVIYVYNYAGEKLKSFGNKGQGPGEFQGVYHIVYQENQNLWYFYDLYHWKIHVYSDTFDYIKSEKTSSIIAGMKPWKDNVLIQVRIPVSVDGSRIFDDRIKVFNPKGEEKTIRNKLLKSITDVEFMLEYGLMFDTNSNKLFVLDKQQNTFSVEEYTDENTKIKWEMEDNITVIDNAKISGIYAGKDFIIIKRLKPEDEEDTYYTYYEFYDFNQHYLGKLILNNKNEYIIDVYESKLIKLVKDENGDYSCSILEVKLL